MIYDTAKSVSKVVVVSEDSPSIAIATEVFRREERSCPHVTDSAYFLFVTIGKSIISTNGLRIVLNHKEVVFFSQSHYGFHISWLTEQMHGYNRFGARSNRFFNSLNVNIKSIVVYIYEYGGEFQQGNHFHSCSEGKISSDNFIAFFESESHHCDLEGISTIGARDDVFHAHIIFQFFLEGLYLGTVDKSGGVEYFFKRSLYFIFNSFILTLKVNHLYFSHICCILDF